MRQLENISLPGELYGRVEECAREHHRSVADEAAAFVAKAMAADDVEAAFADGYSPRARGLCEKRCLSY